MKPTTTNQNRPRKRPDLKPLPVPQRDTRSLAVPLPLPPPTSVSAADLDRLDRLGSGSGGTVYKVIHRPTRRIFALKILSGNHDESARNLIRREIQILRDVDHPNVVRCHDIYDLNGEIHVLLEFMDGGSLAGTLISEESLLSDLSRQVLVGIAYLHKNKIVHRDIKPSNLLINSRNQVKIADFGVSRTLTQTVDCNSSVGTIAYMSPERINADSNRGTYDGYAGDIWSYGVSIMEFYLGRYPFAVSRQGDWASLMCAICMAPPPEPPATASREFRHFVACCLNREPARRWSAVQLLRHPFVDRGGEGGGRGLPNGGTLHPLMPPPPSRPLSS